MLWQIFEQKNNAFKWTDLGFGARLSKLRQSRGLTVSKLADMSHISRTCIFSFEGDGIPPKLKTLSKLAVVLKTSEIFLLTGKTVKRNKTHDPIEHRYWLIRTLVTERAYQKRLKKLLDTFLSTAIRAK
ncbi:MAG TPA: helix-turn-helix transcriptional regulator [Chryseosolibacter sp.]